MYELRWLVENADFVKKQLSRRNHTTESIDKICTIDSERRQFLAQVETLRSRRNQIAKDIGTLKRAGGDASALLSESGQVNKNLEDIEGKLSELQTNVDELLLWIPNLQHESVPEGKGSEENQEVHRRGQPANFTFPPLDHHDLGVKLGILDFDRATRMASTRFTVLLGKAAKLERALISFMLDLHTEKHGYKEMLPPFMGNTKAFIGTGQLPKFKEDQFKIQDHDLYLIPTAEVTVTNYLREEILSEDQLPQLFTAYTPCFRSEAGSYGRDTRGLIRQHQFDKVELVMLAHPDKSWELHESLTNHAEKVLDLLGLPYRRMLLCTGDAGFGSAKTYDLEVWLPAQKAYREISSCTNFLDFQARRADIRFRPRDGGKPRHVHTLNGSGLAVGRTLVAILENYQQADGSILIPDALQRYTGFDRIEMA